jgi:hypothetical protein
MARLALPKTGVVLLFVLFVGTRGRRQPAGLEGYVYSTCADNRLAGPVAAPPELVFARFDQSRHQIYCDAHRRRKS